MNEHINLWIGAYLDGELSADRRRQVEDHLAACPACQQQLNHTRQLSAWLHSVPLPANLPSAGGFAASLLPNLPGRPSARTVSPLWTPPGLAWWLIPLAILSGWVAAQIVILLPEWSQVLLPLEISNAAITWLAPGSVLSLWIDLITAGGFAAHLPQELSASALSLVEIAAFWQGSLLQLGLNAVAALLFMSWLAGLAARRIHLAHQRENG